jgi:hypothetical protein
MCAQLSKITTPHTLKINDSFDLFQMKVKSITIEKVNQFSAGNSCFLATDFLVKLLLPLLKEGSYAE